MDANERSQFLFYSRLEKFPQRAYISEVSTAESAEAAEEKEGSQLRSFSLLFLHLCALCVFASLRFKISPPAPRAWQEN